MIVDRYILRGILEPALFGFTALIAVFAALSAADVLADAVAGRIAGSVIAELVVLRAVIGAEVLLPTAVYLAATWAFARLGRDSELTAMRSSGLSVLRLMRPVVPVALLAFALVAALTLSVRPWAYRLSYGLESRLAAGDPGSLEAGRFYRFGEGLVLLADRVDGKAGRLHGVFAESRHAGALAHVIRADELRVVPAPDGEQRLLEFRDGRATLLRQPDAGDRFETFRTLHYRATLPAAQTVGNHRRARETRSLLTAGLLPGTPPRDVAELQWRIALPALTALMVFVGAVIGIGAPRTGAFARLGIAVTAYVVVFNVAAMARTWVESGDIGALPGLWWLPAVPLVLFAGFHARYRG